MKLDFIQVIMLIIIFIILVFFLLCWLKFIGNEISYINNIWYFFYVIINIDKLILYFNYRGVRKNE